MAKNTPKKFTPKAGNPVKRAEEIEARKAREKAKVAAARRRKDIAFLTKDSNPQDVGGVWTPPAHVEPVQNVPVPQYASRTKEQKTSLRKKIMASSVISLGIVALLASTFMPANDTSYINQNQNVATETQVDENGNLILVDVNGNPIGGTGTTIGTNEVAPKAEFGTDTSEEAPKIEFGSDPDMEKSPDEASGDQTGK